MLCPSWRPCPRFCWGWLCNSARLNSSIYSNISTEIKQFPKQEKVTENCPEMRSYLSWVTQAAKWELLDLYKLYTINYKSMDGMLIPIVSFHSMQERQKRDRGLQRGDDWAGTGTGDNSHMAAFQRCFQTLAKRVLLGMGVGRAMGTLIMAALQSVLVLGEHCCSCTSWRVCLGCLNYMGLRRPVLGECEDGFSVKFILLCVRWRHALLKLLWIPYEQQSYLYGNHLSKELPQQNLLVRLSQSRFTSVEQFHLWWTVM